MAKGDIRQCGFCLKQYKVTANGSYLHQCKSCESRHRRSKNKKIKSEIPLCGGSKITQSERVNRSRQTRKNVELVAAPLNWGNSKT